MTHFQQSCFVLKLFLPFLLLVLPTWSRGEPVDGFGWGAKGNIQDEHIFINDHLLHPSSSDNPVVSTRNGLLRGFITKTIGNRRVASFRGIPYGQPPVGPLRFQPPLKARPWSGIRDATGETPHCIQIDFMTREQRIRGQEDCLFLEVHTPNLETSGTPSQQLPVMVYIHGGSFASGSGGLYGPRYLLDEDVVLVTINYRLGPFGFLSTGNRAAYGNAGLKDQTLAFKWVQENIHQFGGNADSVTIFGQSAGGASVQHHIVSPASQGLFHRAVSHSASSLCWFAISENAPELAVKTGSLFGCYGNSQNMVSCLQSIPAEQLVTAHFNLTDWNNFPIVVFAPVIEAPNPYAFLTEHPEDIYRKGQAAHVPWINGLARYEMSWLLAEFLQFPAAVEELNHDWSRLGSIFLSVGNSTNSGSRSWLANKIRDFYLGRGNTEIGFNNRYEIAQMVGDRYFLKCGLDGMHLHAKYTGEPVYGFEFSFEGKYSIVQLYGQDPEEWGVAHMDDIVHLLNNTEYYPTIQMQGDYEERKMSELMTSTWANFATFGIPYVGRSNSLQQRTPLKTLWKPIQLSHDYGHDDEVDVSSFQFLDLNLTPRMIPNPYVQRYKFWSSLHLDD